MENKQELVMLPAKRLVQIEQALWVIQKSQNDLNVAISNIREEIEEILGKEKKKYFEHKWGGRYER